MTPPPQLVAAIHMAAFLHKELQAAFEELTRGNLQAKADMMAIRTASVDGLYQSLWDHLRQAHDRLIVMGRRNAAFEQAVATLGPVGTRMGVLDATNTFGWSPTVGAGGIGMRAGGEVSVRVNYEGARIAHSVILWFKEALPDVDWTAPPPRRALRPVEPDLKLIDDGVPAESVKPKGRGLAVVATVLLAAAVVVGLVMVATGGGKDAPADRSARSSTPTVTRDELTGMNTDVLLKTLDRVELTPDLHDHAVAELELRFVAALPKDSLDGILRRVELAARHQLSARFFAAAATQVVALVEKVEDLDGRLEDVDGEFRDAVGVALAPKLEARLPGIATLDDGFAYFELVWRLHATNATRAKVGARIAEIAVRDLATLDAGTIDVLLLNAGDLGLPPLLVEALTARQGQLKLAVEIIE